MVQIDVPIAMGIGHLFADAAHKQLQTGRAEYYFRSFAANNIFQVFFFSWIPVYFLMNYFGWETTHMWWEADSIAAYPYYMPIFLVVFFGAANLGFVLGHRLVRANKLWTNRAIYLAILAYATVWLFGQAGRPFKLGTYSDYVEGRSKWFYEDRTFLFMLVLTVVVWLAGLVIFALRLRAEGRHLDARAAAAR